MKTRSRVGATHCVAPTFPVLACLMLTIYACSPSSPAEGPAGGGAQTATQNPHAQDPVAAAVEDPAQREDEELSEAEILQIVRSSIAAFPWRQDQTVVAKASGQTTTTRTRAQSSTRAYNGSVQTLGPETITMETILVDSRVYVKMTGSPAAAYGLVDGQWTEVLPGSPLMQLVDTNAIDPEVIAAIFATDFASLREENGGKELVFKVVGSEEVNGVATNIYESKGDTFTYRWWIGADGRFYKTSVDLPGATRTILIEYDAGIDIQAP